VVKSLLVVSPQKRYYLALLQGNRMLSLHKLGALFGLKGMSMAPQDAVATVTGYEPGSVSPFGLKRKLTVVVDEHVLLQETVSISGGRHEAAIGLKPEDLVRGTGAQVADITQ
jgi:Cys-tRNA(Pro)/Cys-tRNA(Cys) deacylase